MDIPTPEILYRYRHLVGDHREWTANILRSSVLHFASPESFNDPFDCKVHFKRINSDKELRRHYLSLIKKYEPSLTRANRRAKATKNLKRVNSGRLLEDITASLQAKVDQVGVLSLSASYDDVLMWSHYAASHKGLCLGFSVETDATYFAPAQSVNYSAAYPEIDMLHNPPMEQVEAFLLTKAEHWRYENEWRIIDHDTGPGGKAFLEQALVKVILGARMLPDDRTFVFDCLKGRKHRVSVFEAVVNPGSYALDIRPYEP